MRPTSHLRSSKIRPLSFSLARLSSAAAVAAALLAAGQSAQAQNRWFGSGANGNIGDGFLWSDVNNWESEPFLPVVSDDVVFDDPLATPATILLNGNRDVRSVSFTDSYTLGAFGSTNVLTTTVGDVSVAATKFATINAILAGTGGLNLTGGGTLFLTNGLNQFTGNIAVTGTNTTLLASYVGQPTPASRSDALALGQTTRSITLSNGGAIKFIGSAYNPDGATKNFVFGDGGGVLNIAAGFQRMTLDDASQIQATGANPAFVKEGQGSVQLITQDFNIAMTGGITVNAGVLQLGRTQGNAAAARFSAFTAGSATTVNSGGHLTLSGGTLGIFDQNLTLNAGGILSITGAEHEFGMRGQLTIGGAAISSNTLTLNGGTILARDSFDPQTARFPRLQGIMQGSGTVTFATLGASGGNSRMVFQRSDLPHTFNGTFVAEGNVALEVQPRNNDVNLASAYSGNAVGGGSLGIFPTLELRGFNSSADIRNAGGVATRNGSLFITAWNSNTDLPHDNNIAVTDPNPGGIQRLVATTAAPVSNGGASGAAPAAGIAPNTNIGGGTGNVLHFKNLAMGNNRLLLTNANSYGARFDTMTLTGATPAVALLELNATSGKIEINGNISEHLAGDGLARWGNLGDLNLSGQVGLATLNVRAGTVNLFGPNGAVVAPNLSATGSVIVNGGGVGGAMPAGFLNLQNDLANTGGSVAATNNNNRLADNVPVTLLGNSVLRLTSLSANNTTETTGNVSVTGFPSAEVAKQGVAPGQVALTLGATAPLNLSANSGVSFTAAALGTAGVNTSRIFLFGQGDSAFLGANFTSGTTVGAANANEWATYDLTTGRGVIPFAAYTLNPGVGAWANHVKVTAANTLLGSETATTLNIQVAAAVAIGANNLTLNAGGILASTGTNGVTGTTGTLTTGAGQQQLFVTNNVTTDINAIIRDNGGAVTLVKNGTGNLRLTNQGQALGGGSSTTLSPIAATHANTFTGGIFVNSGQLEIWKPQYAGGNQITLQGGAVLINQGSVPGLANAAIAWGNNVVVSTNSSFVNDDNGESGDALVGQNTTYDFGTLTVSGAHVLSTGGFVSDNRFTAATFTGNPTINLGVARTTNSMTIINGVQAGSGFQIEAFGNTAGSYVLGGGAADVAPNTYAGTVYIGRTSGNTDPILRLDKANGVTALTGDLIINQATLAFGPGQNLTNNTALNDTNNNLAANRFGGISVAAQYGAYASGQNQIAPTATITLLAGNLGENGRLNNSKFGTLVQKNGTLNPGFGLMEVDSWQMSGGAIAFNSGGTFRAGAATLSSGAQEINIANNFVSAQTRLEIGAGGLTLTGQSISFGGNNYVIPGAGAVLQLGGPLIVNADPLNLSDTDRQKGFFAGSRDIGAGGGRELARNILDLAGGVRTIAVDGNIFYNITTLIQNGGFHKTGAGSLSIQNWFDNTTTMPIAVLNGNLIVRGANALGTSPVTVLAGGTLKLDGGWTLANDLRVDGSGALIPNGSGVREFGALVAEAGYNRVLGAVVISGGTTIGANYYQNPSASPTTGAVGNASPLIRATLSIESAGGITGTGNLTITGSGDGQIVNGVRTTLGGLKKEGGGTWTISGPSTYDGATTVEAGILRIAHGAALGTVGGDTTVYGGNSLVVTGGIASAEPLVLHGTGFGGLMGVLSNVGTNTLSGQVTLGGDALLRSAGGNLTITSVVLGTDTTLTVGGAGNTAINGIIATGSGALVKNDRGTLTLRGGNTYTGATLANGGTLALDFATSNASKIAPFGSLTLGGGSVSVLGNAGAATVQTVGQLDLVAGGGTVSVSGSGGQTATLDVGPINRFVGASVNFATATNGAILTTALNVGGILGGYATFGNDWAEATAGQIQAYSGPSPVFTSASLPTDNALLAATAGPITAATVNSLKISGGKGFQTPGLALNSGGLLYTSTGEAGIALANPPPVGTGLLQGADANADLFVHTTGGVLTIGLPIIGAGSGALVKAGAGTLMLCAPSVFTGNVYVNGGTLEILGPGGTADATVLGNVSKNINLNGGTFSIRSGDYDPSPGVNPKNIVVGAAGGGLSVANGQLLLNDAGQFSGTGTLTKTGAGTLNIGAATTGFTGDAVVQQGILRVASTGSVGGRAGQSVTFAANTAYVHEATTAGTYEFNGATIGIQGGDRQFLGPVTFSGSNKFYMGDMIGALQNARSVQFVAPISGSGAIELFGNNQAGRLQVQSGANSFNGTITMNANTGLEFRPPTSAALTPGGIAVNMNGANSRVLIRHYTGGDFNLNLSASNDVEIFAGQIDNYGLGSQVLMKVNSFSVSGSNRLIAIAGSGNDWFTVNNAVTAPGNNTILNTTTNAAFMAGASFGGVAGGVQGLDKRGGSVLASYGPVTSVGPVIIQAGTIDLRGGGTLTAPAVELRGNGSLLFSNNIAEGSNANRYTGPITLGGGTLRVFGTTNLGILTAVGGSNDIRYSMDTQTGYVPLVLTGITRSLGAHIQINSDFGTVGAVSLQNTNPRMHFPGGHPLDVDTFGTGAVGSVDIIPGYTNGNEFVGYRTALDGAVKIGLFQVGNGFMRTDAADGTTAGLLRSATAPNEIMRFTAGRTLAGNATFRALKMDGASTTTLDVATFGLRIERGMINHVANDNRIGGTGTLTAGVVGAPAEMQFTVNAGNLFVAPAIVNNGAGGTVSVVKNGAGTLVLEGASVSSYTGNTFVNAGTLQVRSAARLGAAATNALTMQGGNLELQVDAGAANQAIPFGHDIVVKGNGLIGTDNGAAAGFIGHIYALGGLTINGPYTLQTAGFDDTDLTFAGAVTFNGTPTLDLLNGRSGTAAGQTYTLRLAGAIGGAGGYYVTSTGAAAGTNPTPGRLFLGNGAADAVPNTNAGTLTIQSPTSSGQNTVTLDKQAGTDAVAGDVVINGGFLVNNANEQIKNTSRITVNGFGSANANYGWNLNAKTETITELTMNGGLVTTGALGQLTVSTNVTLSGTSAADGLQIVSGTGLATPTLVTIGGNLTVNEFGRTVVGAAFAALEVGTLTLNGGTVFQTTGGNVNNVRLNGDVTATSAVFTPASLGGNANDSDTYLDLRGTRTFNVANGPHEIDLIVGSIIQNGPAAGLGATGGTPFGVGAIIKTGAGVLSIQNTNAALNTFTGGVIVNAGTLELARGANNNSATGTGSVTINAGGTIRVRNNEQISNSAAVAVNAGGVLDLDFGCATETIGTLTGAGLIKLSASNTLIVNQAVNGTYSGEISGPGSVIKNGAAKLVLDGILDFPELRVNAGRLDLATVLGSGSSTLNANANTETNISVSQTLGALNIADGAIVRLGFPLPSAPAGEDFGMGGDGGLGFGGAAIPVQGVPEPGTATLLIGGLLTMLGLRRRRG